MNMWCMIGEGLFWMTSRSIDTIRSMASLQIKFPEDLKGVSFRC
jgi:hypothetical protein